MAIDQHLKCVPDYPKPGIVFRDISPLLANDKICRMACQRLVDATADLDYDIVAGLDARGFIVMSHVAALSPVAVGTLMINRTAKFASGFASATHKDSTGESSHVVVY